MSPIEFRKDWLITHGGWPISIPKSKIGTAIADLKNLLDVDVGWRVVLQNIELGDKIIP